MGRPYDKYWTLCPPLARCLAESSGPVLEIGSGYYSTQIIQAMLAGTGRRHVIIEPDAWWRRNIRVPGAEVRDSDLLPIDSYGVVLIDNGPAVEDRDPWCHRIAAAMDQDVGMGFEYLLLHDANHGHARAAQIPVLEASLGRARLYSTASMDTPSTAIWASGGRAWWAIDNQRAEAAQKGE